MRKLLIAGIAGLTVACSSADLTKLIDAIVANAKVECGIAVNAADLAAALSGQNPALVLAATVAHSMCQQYLAQAPAATMHEKLTAGQATYVVVVNNKPVHVQK
jgi:hypothetical protein